MTFYKIVDNLPQVGSGTKAPEGFIEYDPENPPKELQDALNLQNSIQEKEEQLRDAKKYLQETDWIIAKIGELQMEGLSIEMLVEKYGPELEERKEKRRIINTLESE